MFLNIVRCQKILLLLIIDIGLPSKIFSFDSVFELHFTCHVKIACNGICLKAHKLLLIQHIYNPPLDNYDQMHKLFLHFPPVVSLLS